MSRLQKGMIALAGLIAVLVFFSNPSQALIQSQRDQIGVTITVNVTPNPLGYVPRDGSPREGISARFALRARGSSDSVDSTKILDLGKLVAQTQAQSALKVQAQVTPNPNGTLLYSNNQSVAVNGTAGTTVTVPCIYTVTIDTKQTSWTLREGLSNDLSGSSFPGSDIANNSYLQGNTPQPAATPFIVYPTNWTIMATSGLAKTYCVDLVVTIPSTAAQGAYSTNAIYTLFY